MRIPEFNEFDGCPKCRLAGDDTTAGLMVTATFHPSPTEGEACQALLMELTGEQEEELEFGEHLCRRCVRCGFSWVERVVRLGSVYVDRPDDEPAGEYQPCGCDFHGDHAACEADCQNRGCREW